MTAVRVCLAVFTLLASFASTSLAAVNITLESAIRQGKVKVNVNSLGGATGNGVRVDVESLVDEELHIEVEPGAVLLNASASHQNLGVGGLKGELTVNNTYVPGKVMVLADRKPRSFLLEIFCLDAAKQDPQRGTSLKVAVKDSRVARILAASRESKSSVWATQLAIWIDRSGISVEKARQLHPGKISDVDVKVAYELVEKAEADGVKEIPKGMPADVRVQVGKLYSPKPAVRAMAAESLGAMGVRARLALPYLSENLLDRSTDKPLPVNVVGAEGGVKDIAKSLESLGLPKMAPLLYSLASIEGRPTKGRGARFRAPRLKRLAIKALGIEVKDGQIQIEQTSSAPTRQVMVETLLPRLESKNAAVRERAAWLLGTLRARDAVAPLIELLEHPDAGTVRAAAAALEAITGREYGTNAKDWRAWWNEQEKTPPKESSKDGQ